MLVYGAARHRTFLWSIVNCLLCFWRASYELERIQAPANLDSALRRR